MIVTHLLAMTGSALRHTPLGPPIREWTRPWEQFLGVHQTWPMFGVAPRTTLQLEMEGRLGDGTTIDLPGLGGRTDPQGVIWRYSRRNKLMRNATAPSRKYLRASFVRWQCREASAQGLPLREVLMSRTLTDTPRPGSHAGHRSTWRVRSPFLETWNCKR